MGMINLLICSPLGHHTLLLRSKFLFLFLPYLHNDACAINIHTNVPVFGQSCLRIKEMELRIKKCTDKHE